MGDLCVCGHGRDEHEYVGESYPAMCMHTDQPDGTPVMCDCLRFRAPCLGCGDPIDQLDDGLTYCTDCAAQAAFAGEARS